MGPTTSEESAVASLTASFATLRRNKWLILATIIMLVGFSLFLSYRKVPVYAATTRVLVQATSANPSAYFTINLDTERGLAESAAVAQVVSDGTGGVHSVQELLASVSVRVEPSTEILAITYTSPVPKDAAILADGFGRSYLEFRRAGALAQFQQQTGDLRTRVAELNSQRQGVLHRLSQTKDPVKQQTIQGEYQTLQTRIGILQEQIATLGTPESLAKSGGDIVQRATVPTAPSSPNHMQDGLLALIAGAILGSGIALARERFDQRLHGSEDLERRLGAPVLATIPHIADWKTRDDAELIMLSEPTSPTAEAYRALRTNLQFIGRRDSARVIAITSPFMGEGKTTTVANLAVALAQSGKRVIAISCDLRRPRLHRFFNCSNEVGLTDILTDGVGIEDAAQRPAGIEGVRLLASGPIPINPAELLDSEAMGRLLTEVREAGDFVLLDLPPLLAVADGLVLGPHADGVLVVVDAAATSRGAAEAVRIQMEQVGGHILGGIFNNFDHNSKAYPYDYRSAYPYSYAYTGYASDPVEIPTASDPDLSDEGL